MNKEIILVTGGTGLIGAAIVNRLISENRKVIVSSRDAESAIKTFGSKIELLQWDGKTRLKHKDTIKSITHVIHLMGAGIAARRWDAAYKKEIIDSRINSCRLLLEGFLNCNSMPVSFVCSSATGFYGNRGDEILTEDSHKGTGFLADVCDQWEKAAAEFGKYGCHFTSLRTGVVLDANQGALQRFIMPYKFFVGGPLGSGRQWFSWIHIQDAAGIYVRALNSTLPPVVNCTAPQPVRMSLLAEEIGAILGRPAFFKVPVAALRLAIGEAAEEITASQRVVPDALVKSGFHFRFNNISEALRDLLR